MSLRIAVKQHSAAPPNEAAATSVAIEPAVRVKTAANDDESASEFSIAGDPLWGMAIASVILFATFAALIALA